MPRKAQTHWFGLYRTLRPKIDAHEGDESIHQLIRREAEAANYDEKVLKRMLNAGAFLDRISETPLLVEQVKCGFAHVELLERLYKLNAPDAQARITAILNNQVTQKQIREALDSMAAESGHAQLTARSRARQRVAEHQRLCLQLAQRTGPSFFGSPDGEMVLVKRFRTLSHFILINDPDQPIAVIPRLGDSSMKEGPAAEELLTLAMSVKRYFQRIWLLLPSNSTLAQELVARAEQIGAFESWLYLATPDEDSSALVPYRNRRRALEKDLRGDDDCAWEGVSLRDGRKLSGSLDPIEKS
ncbi:hypothetical protein [Pseudomonas sp.]|uniref:hypothetical protein n=1 Tax=Pseudomonas sp. TaxID=306 RepID=UPI003A97E6D7